MWIALVSVVRLSNSKLDLTLNFVNLENLESSVDCLEKVTSLRELYLVGNPLTDWEHWKTYIIARLPQLRRLEGEEITKTRQI